MPPPMVTADAHGGKVVLSTALETDGRGLRLYIPYVGAPLAPGEDPVGWTRSQKAALVREMVEAAGSEPVATVRVLVPAARLKAEGGRALVAEMRGYLEPAFAARGQDLPQIRARCARCFWRKRRLAGPPEEGISSPSRACPRVVIRTFAGPSASLHLAAAAGPRKRERNGVQKKGDGSAAAKRQTLVSSPRSEVGVEDAPETKKKFSSEFIWWFHYYRQSLQEKQRLKTAGFKITDDIADIFPGDKKYSHLSHVYELRIITNIGLGEKKNRTFIFIGDRHDTSTNACYRGNLCGNMQQCFINVNGDMERCKEVSVLKWVKDKVIKGYKLNEGKFLDIFIESKEQVGGGKDKSAKDIPTTAQLQKTSYKKYSENKKLQKEPLPIQFQQVFRQYLLHTRFKDSSHNLRVHYADFRARVKLPTRENRNQRSEILNRTIFNEIIIIIKALQAEKLKFNETHLKKMKIAINLFIKFTKFLGNDEHFHLEAKESNDVWKDKTHKDLYDLAASVWGEQIPETELTILLATVRFLYKVCVQMVHFNPEFRQKVVEFFLLNEEIKKITGSILQLKFQPKAKEIEAILNTINFVFLGSRLMDIYTVCRMLRPDITLKNDLTILVAGAFHCKYVFRFLVEKKFAHADSKIFINRIHEDPLCLKIRPSDDSSDNDITAGNLAKYVFGEDIESLNLNMSRKVTPLGGEILAYLSLHKGLVKLDINSSKAVDSTLLKVFSDYKTKFEELYLSNCPNINNICLKHLSQLEHLTNLDISNCKQITENGLAYFSKWKKYLFLRIAKCTNIKPEYLQKFKKNLEANGSELYISQITDRPYD